MRFDQRINCLGHVFERCNFEINAVKDLVAAHINHLALLIHHFVVLQHVLTNFGVTCFDSTLSAFDGFGDHLVFNCFVIRQCTSHDPTQCTGREQTHQFVFKAQIETTRAGVTLTARSSTQLIVDTTTLMTLRANDIQATDFTYLVAFGLALC